MSGVRIRGALNGYIVEYNDPEVVKRNSTSHGYEDPERVAVCTTVEDAVKLVGKILPLLDEAEAAGKENEYDVALTQAVKEASK